VNVVISTYWSMTRNPESVPQFALARLGFITIASYRKQLYLELSLASFGMADAGLFQLMTGQYTECLNELPANPHTFENWWSRSL